MAKGHTRFAALFDVSMVFNTVIYVFHIGVSGFLVEGMETDQFVDFNEDVALH